ncbi:MAG: Lrp/AsnC family transcriptional regulator [Eubacterium sp.]|nr:Lrp/AsnC family transcriptional regulator [Eubacterium sp.]
MDKTDEEILDLLKGNARMSFQELGDQIGMSRVAAKKRVQKLEQEGVIRGYNTCIYRENQYTAFIDITTTPEGYSKVLRYITDRTAYIRQIFRTTKENHLHIVAISTEVANLKYLVKMIRKSCKNEIKEISCHGVKEVIILVFTGYFSWYHINDLTG